MTSTNSPRPCTRCSAVIRRGCRTRPRRALPELIELHSQPVEPLPEVNADLMAAVLAGLSPEAEARPTAAAFRDQLAAIDLGGLRPQ